MCLDQSIFFLSAGIIYICVWQADTHVWYLNQNNETSNVKQNAPARIVVLSRALWLCAADLLARTHNQREREKFSDCIMCIVCAGGLLINLLISSSSRATALSTQLMQLAIEVVGVKCRTKICRSGYVENFNLWLCIKYSDNGEKWIK